MQDSSSSFSLELIVFQHVQQIKEHQSYEIMHTDGIREQYDDKLLQELQQLRVQNEQEMLLLREEIAGQYEKKVSKGQLSGMGTV
jgi:signal recognition particle GTPase